MASDDFYVFSARQRLQQINANRAQALADLEVAKASADYESAASSVQEIANLDAQRQAIVNLHDQKLIPVDWAACRIAPVICHEPD
jgi:hypothetical protein